MPVIEAQTFEQLKKVAFATADFDQFLTLEMLADDAFDVAQVLLELAGMRLLVLVVGVVAELVGIERGIEDQTAALILHQQHVGTGRRLR